MRNPFFIFQPGKSIPSLLSIEPVSKTLSSGFLSAMTLAARRYDAVIFVILRGVATPQMTSSHLKEDRNVFLRWALVLLLSTVTVLGCGTNNNGQTCSSHDDCISRNCFRGYCDSQIECKHDVPPEGCEGAIEFGSEDLEDEIRDELDSLKDTFEYTDVVDLLYLSAENKDDSAIDNLDGLQCLTCLQWLKLDDNQIDDLGPIRELTDLFFLSLKNNNIEKIDSLGHLEKLRVLDLSNNEIPDISPLYDLKQLETLSLSISKSDSIEQLKELTTEKSLHLSLSKSTIDDLGSLKELKKTWILDLSDTIIEDICPILDIALEENEPTVEPLDAKSYALIKIDVESVSGSKLSCDDPIACSSLAICENETIRTCLYKVADKIFKRNVILDHDCSEPL